MSNKRAWVRHTATTTLVLFAGSTLTSCKATMARLKSFKSESTDGWEYLIERTVSFSGSGSSVSDSSFMSSYNTSTPNALGNLSSFDATAPGTGAAFAQSMDSIGMCYWYAKVPKNGPADSGFALDNADGTPNMGIRNNLIARAGVPLTNNVVSLNEVLQAMHDAGGELKRIQGDISAAAVKMNDVLLQGVASSTAAALAAGGTAAGTGAIYQKLGPANREGLTKMAREFTGSLAALGDSGNGKRTGFALLESIPRRAGALSGINTVKPTIKVGNLNGVPHVFKTYRIPNGPNGKISHIVEIAVSKEGKPQYRAVSLSSKFKNISAVKFREATPQIISTLNLSADEVKDLGLKSLRSARFNAVAFGNSAAQGTKTFAKNATKNVISACKGGPLQKLMCMGVVATAVGMTLTIPKAFGASKAKSNDAEVAKTVQSVLNDPKIAANVSAIMAKLEKETLITPELMEALRKQLIAKSAASTRGSCNQTFGTEILTTPGVADAGYDVGASGGFTSPNSGYTPSLQPSTDPSASLPSLPTTPSESLQDMPTDFSSDPSLSSDTSSLGTSTDTSMTSDSSTSTDSSAMDPSTLPAIPADQQDLSSTTSTDDPSMLDSSLDSSTTSGGDATSL